MFCDFLKKILKWSSASLPLFKFVNKYFSICWREQIWVLSPCARDTFMNQNRDFYALVTVTASNRIWGLQIPKHLLEEVKSPIKTSFAAKRWSLSISWGKFYLYTIRDIDARRNTVFKTLTAAWFNPVSLFDYISQRSWLTWSSGQGWLCRDPTCLPIYARTPLLGFVTRLQRTLVQSMIQKH